MALLPRCVTCNRVIGGLVRFKASKVGRQATYYCVLHSEIERAPEPPAAIEYEPLPPLQRLTFEEKLGLKPRDERNR